MHSPGFSCSAAGGPHRGSLQLLVPKKPSPFHVNFFGLGLPPTAVSGCAYEVDQGLNMQLAFHHTLCCIYIKFAVTFTRLYFILTISPALFASVAGLRWRKVPFFCLTLFVHRYSLMLAFILPIAV